MKSMLQEGSSVQKAVESAWISAGKPKEFTIRILEFGNKNFIGITTQPAVVSIIYKPEMVRRLPDKNKKSSKSKNTINGKIKKGSSGIFKSLFGKTKPKKKVERRPFQKNDKYKKGSSQQKNTQTFWKKEFANTVTSWLKEMLGIMNIKVSTDVNAEQRILNVYLNKRILNDGEEEKLFFISLSHLLMQFLKRKYKKRFSNYYLIIHTKTFRGNEQKK